MKPKYTQFNAVVHTFLFSPIQISVQWHMLINLRECADIVDVWYKMLIIFYNKIRVY